MSTFAARRAANKEGRTYTVKTGFNRIFTHQGVAAKVQEAVHLVTPILTEGSLLANLHILRCIESGADLPALGSTGTKGQTFFNNCYAAVTYSTGFRAQQFDTRKCADLTASYELYCQLLPANHIKPERPTYLKDVSTTWLTHACSLYALFHVALALTSTTVMTESVLQILNAAAQRAHGNLLNHVATNFFPRTARWIRRRVVQMAHFAQLPSRIISSWVRLLCQVATEGSSSILQLLPRFSSLSQPPLHVLEDLEELVATVYSLMGPMPVTDASLSKQPESYMHWLHRVLVDFQAAQGTPNAPKLFTMAPQTSHHRGFIKISTTGLHK